MSVEIGSILARMALDKKGFDAGLEESKKQVQGFGEYVKNNEEKIKKLGKQMTVAGGLIVGALGAAVKSTANYGDQLSKTSQRTGVATERLAAYKLMADESDTSLEAVSTSIALMSRKMAEAAEGSDTAAKAFSDLGVSVVNADGSLRPTQEVFDEMIGAFAEMPDGAEKTALAMELFGRSGSHLIPMLNMGAAGLQEYQEKAEGLGLALSKDAAQASADFNDQLTQLSKSFQAGVVQIGTALMPALTSLAGVITTVVEKVVAFARENPGLTKTLVAIAAAVGGFMVVAGPFLIILPKLAAGFGMVSIAAKKLTVALLTNPLVAAAAAGIALIKVINGINSAYDEAINKLHEAAEREVPLRDKQRALLAELDKADEEVFKARMARMRELGIAEEDQLKASLTWLRSKIGAERAAEIERSLIRQEALATEALDIDQSNALNLAGEAAKQGAKKKTHDLGLGLIRAASVETKSNILGNVQAHLEGNAIIDESILASAESQIATAEQVAAALAKNRQDWFDKTVEAISGVQKWFGDFAGAIGDLWGALTERKLQDLETWYEAERARINDTITDHEERTQALEKLDAEYQAKQRAARKAEAIYNKAVSIIEAGINVALGITAALRSANIGLALAIGALGAIQIGAIIAKPIPMAEGGVVMPRPGGTLAQLGEAGKPEAVIPLDKYFGPAGPAGLGDGGGKMEVNITINALDSESVERITRRRIAPYLQQLIRQERFSIAPAMVRA